MPPPHTGSSWDRIATRKAWMIAVLMWLVGVVLGVDAWVERSATYAVGAALMLPAGVLVLISDREREGRIGRQHTGAHLREGAWLVAGIGVAGLGLLIATRWSGTMGR